MAEHFSMKIYDAHWPRIVLFSGSGFIVEWRRNNDLSFVREENTPFDMFDR